MKKKRIIRYISIFMLIAVFVASCILFTNKGYTAQINYSSWQNIDKIQSQYSYSTIFYVLGETTITDLTPSDKAIDFNTAEGQSYTYLAGWSNIFPGHEKRILISKCATNANGELLDVVVKVNNVVAFSKYDESEHSKVSNNKPRAKFLIGADLEIPTSQTTPMNTTVTHQTDFAYAPIVFEFESWFASADFTITYYKTGTYNDVYQSGELGGINAVSGFYWDLDVPAKPSCHDISNGNECDGQLFGGNEGFTPSIGSSTIYYDSDNHSASYSHVLDTYGNTGIAIQKRTSENVNGVYYESSAFMTTEGLSSSFTFRYSGTDCGINYMFASPYPFTTANPIKSTSKDTLPSELDRAVLPGESFNYYITQYIPNNYYGTLFSFNEIYKNLYRTSRYNSFVISDELNQNLTVNGDIKIYNELNKDVTSYFNVSVAGKTITATANPSMFNDLSFYAHTYRITVPVVLDGNISNLPNFPNTANTTTTICKGDGTCPSENGSSTVTLKVKHRLNVNFYQEGTGLTVYPSDPELQLLYGSYYNTTYSGKVDESVWQFVRSDGGDVAGNITRDTTVNYYFQKRPYKLTINYYEEGSNAPIDNPRETILRHGDGYSTDYNNINLSKWQFVRSDGDPTTGTITRDTVVNYYFQKIPYTLTVNYLQSGTNAPIDTTDGVNPKVTSPVYYDDGYSTNYDNVNLSKWRLTGSNGDATSGTIRGNTTVNYYFEKIPYTLTVNFLEEGTGKPVDNVAPDVTNPIYYDDYYTTKYDHKVNLKKWRIVRSEVAKGEGSIVNDQTKVTEGTIRGDTVVNYYFEKIPYTLTVNFLEEGTGKPVDNVDPDVTNPIYYDDQYTTKYNHKVNLNKWRIVRSEVNITDDTTVSNIKEINGIIRGDTVVNYYFEKIPYTLTINYLESGSNKPIDTLDNINPKTKNPVYYDDLYDTDYSNVNPKKWRIIEADSTAAEYEEADDTHIITNVYIRGDTTVNYYFEKIPYTLTVNYLEEGTNKPIDTLDKVNPKITNPIYYDDEYSTDYSNVNPKKWKIIRSEVSIKEDSTTAEDKTISGILRGDTVVNYYFEKIPYTLTVNLYEECNAEKQDCSNWNYVLIDTLDGVNPKKTYPIYYDDEYSTDYSNVNLKKWRIIRSEVNITEDTKVSDLKEIDGIIRGDTTVNYYFEMIPYPVSVNYYDTKSREKIAETDETIYYYDMIYYTDYDKINMDVWEYVSTDGDPIKGKITGDQESYTINYYFNRLKYELVVNYYDDVTKEKIDKSESVAYNFGDEYDTNYDKIDENYWEYVRTEGETPGVIDEDKEVDYYFNNKEYTLEVNYYDEETGEKIDETEVSSYKFDEEYTTNDDKIDKKKWELVEEPANKEGKVDGDIEVNYYYRKKKYKITVNYYEDGTENKIMDSRESEAYYEEPYITDYNGIDESVWTLLEMPDNYQGKVDGDIVVNYYFKQVVIENPPTGINKTLNVFIPIVSIITILSISIIIYRIYLKRKIYKI